MTTDLALTQDYRCLISLAILQQLEPLDISLISLKLKGVTVKKISETLDLPFEEVTNKLRTQLIKQALEDAKLNIKHGLIKPHDTASRAEKEIIEEFFRITMDKATSLDDKLKFGNTVLKYRQGIVSSMNYMSGAESIPNTIDPLTKGRMSEHLGSDLDSKD